MEKLARKYESLCKALWQLEQGVLLYGKIKKNIHLAQLRGGDGNDIIFQYEPIALASRESMIQRFECTIDLFWKYLRLHMEQSGTGLDEIASPKNSIRLATSIKLLTPEESSILLDMITDRNLSSHIYKEEIAQKLAEHIPHYYEYLSKIVSKIHAVER